MHMWVYTRLYVYVAQTIIKTDADDACMCDNIFYFLRLSRMCAAMARKSSSASEHVNIYGAHTNIARIVTITRYIHPPNHPPTRLQEEEEETPTNSAISLAPDGFCTFSLQSPTPQCNSFWTPSLPPPVAPPAPPPPLLLALAGLSQDQFVRPIVSCVDGRAPPPPHSQSYWPASGLASLDSRTTSACFESNHNMIMRAMIISVPPVTYPAL